MMSLMTSPDLAHLNKEISASHAIAEDSNRMTPQLLSELRELSVFPGVFGPAQAWVSRRGGCSVKFKVMGIEFAGSAEDLHKLIETPSTGKNL